MKHITLVFILLGITLSSCSDSEHDGTLVSDTTSHTSTDSVPVVKSDSVPVQTTGSTLSYSSEDAVNLLLFEKFSLGITYNGLKQKISGVKMLHAEDGNEQLGLKGLKECSQDIYFLKYKGKLEFNFKNDSLYRYSIVFTEPDETKGAELYEQILDYYNDHLGTFQPVSIEEDNHYAQLHTWYLNPDYLVAVYNLNTGNITIAAQNTKPGQQQ
ncbi:MAG: hypothetical protein H7259_03795 [Cytophagales bacterium]|nr:hypothetical protein [Cytophaga sp.]